MPCLEIARITESMPRQQRRAIQRRCRQLLGSDVYVTKHATDDQLLEFVDMVVGLIEADEEPRMEMVDTAEAILRHLELTEIAMEAGLQ